MIIITEVVAVRLLVVSAEAEVSEAEAASVEAASVEEWAEEGVPVHDSSQFTTPTKT